MRRLGFVLALLAIVVFVAADSVAGCRRGRRSRRCCQPCVQQCCPTTSKPVCSSGCTPAYSSVNCAVPSANYPAVVCPPAAHAEPAYPTGSYPADSYEGHGASPVEGNWAPAPTKVIEDGTEAAPVPPATPDDDLPESEGFPAPEEEMTDEEGDKPETDEPAPEDDAPEDDAPKDDAPKDDAPKDDAPKDDAPKDDAPEEPAEDAAPPADARSGDTSEEVATAVAEASLEPQWRMWTDASGKHQTKAVLISVNLATGKVSLRKENGVRIGVPLEKLSAADRDFINTLSPAVARVAR